MQKGIKRETEWDDAPKAGAANRKRRLTIIHLKRQYSGADGNRHYSFVSELCVRMCGCADLDTESPSCVNGGSGCLFLGHIYYQSGSAWVWKSSLSSATPLVLPLDPFLGAYHPVKGGLSRTLAVSDHTHTLTHTHTHTLTHSHTHRHTHISKQPNTTQHNTTRTHTNDRGVEYQKGGGTGERDNHDLDQGMERQGVERQGVGVMDD